MRRIVGPPHGCEGFRVSGFRGFRFQGFQVSGFRGPHGFRSFNFQFSIFNSFVVDAKMWEGGKGKQLGNFGGVPVGLGQKKEAAGCPAASLFLNWLGLICASTYPSFIP